jgi:aldose 1-epimerase
MKRINKGFSILLLISFGLMSTQCKNNSDEKPVKPVDKGTSITTSITKEDFGVTPAGEKVDLYTLRNKEGMEVKIMTYGGIITSLKAPDKEGNYKDVVLGYDSLEQYAESNPYFGAIIGRYGNRLAEGKFSLDGTEYVLSKNDGENHLHGGNQGFDKVVWSATPGTGDKSNSLQLGYTSPDMEEGYPGELKTTVTYTLNEDNSLDVEYAATTDKKTIVNLTQHSYFNLSADFNQTILDHVLEINANQYLPVDKGLIPTGELKDVAGTPFDFREPKTVGKEINDEDSNEQLRRGLGYDHCWVLNEQESGMRFAASAYHPETGRLLEIHTNEPGIQFYSGNFLDATLPQKGGEGTYAKRTGFCLETQHYPDSPNQEGFPSVVLEPGEKYSSKTTFKFLVK